MRPSQRFAAGLVSAALFLWAAAVAGLHRLDHEPLSGIWFVLVAVGWAVMVIAHLPWPRRP